MLEFIQPESWVFILEHGLGEKIEEEIDKFQSELNQGDGNFGRNESVVVLGDLNARFGNYVIEGVVCHHGVSGRNESAKQLLEMCEEQELVVGNSWLRKRYVHI